MSDKKRTTLVGLDIGYNGTKFWSTLYQGLFPSVTGTPEQSSFGYNDRADSIILTHPVHVSVGVQAIEQSASIDSRIDRNWLESDKWKTLALAAFSEATRSSVSMNLVCGLPVRYYHDKEQVVDRLLGQHTFQRQGRNRQTVTVEECTVMPQGFGALFSECLNDAGNVTDKTLRWGRVGLLDTGGMTTNLLVANAASMVNRRSGSIEAGGWDVVSRVMSYLSSDYPDLNLSEYELIEHVKSKSINYNGKLVDLTGVVDDAIKTLATRIIGEARRLWKGAARLDAILICGGGAHMIGSALLEEFPQARIVQGDPVFSNAWGYWRFCKARAAAR